MEYGNEKKQKQWRCSICDTTLSAPNKSRHEKGTEHLLKAAQQQGQRRQQDLLQKLQESENKQEELAQKLHNLEQRLQESEQAKAALEKELLEGSGILYLERFLALPGGALEKVRIWLKDVLPSSTVKSIAEGLVFYPPGAQAACQPPFPSTFPAAWAWNSRPDYDEAVNGLLLGMRSEDACYTSGHPGRCPTATPWEVARDLTLEPPREIQHYAVNLRSPLVNVRIPHHIAQTLSLKDDQPKPPTTTNLTPTWTTVECHIDHGKNVITVLLRCIKLWILWPPTPHNLKIYKQCYCFPSRWDILRPQLEYPCSVLTTERKGIHIPPGWLHWTLTLREGMTTGIEFATPECLEITTKIWDAEFSQEKKTAVDNQPLVDAILIAYSCESTRERALNIFCERKKSIQLDSAQRKALKAIVRNLGGNCTYCGKVVKDHFK